MILLEHIQGCTLADTGALPKDVIARRCIIADVIRADRYLLSAGIRHQDVACRNLILRTGGGAGIDPQEVDVDFGHVKVDPGDSSSDVARRWSGSNFTLDFRSRRWICSKGKGDSEVEIAVCLAIAPEEGEER